MPSSAVRFTGLTALLAVLLALAAYFAALNSDHAATNGDELLYAQMTYATAESGHWLPLQTLIERHRNTKPPDFSGKGWPAPTGPRVGASGTSAGPTCSTPSPPP